MSVQKLPTIRYALLIGQKKIQYISTTPELDSELLLSHTIKQTKEYIFTHPERELTRHQQAHFSKLLTRRAQHEPVAYLIGHKEFFGLNFCVNPNVLIPRPDTELLVTEGLRHCSRWSNPSVVDIGTGSGAIAVAFKKLKPMAQVWAVDNSLQALRLAKKNAKANYTPITFLHGSLLTVTRNLKFDCILSNPPYLSKREATHVQLKHEPNGALYGGRGGLDIYKKLIAQLPNHLNPNAVVLLEIGASQAKSVAKLAAQVFPTARLSVHKDLAGHDRVLVIQTKSRAGIDG